MSRGRNCCKCVTVSLVPTASLILVIVFACGIIVLPTLYIELSHEYKYGIVIDAGSTHTMLYAYRWRIPTFNHSTGVIDVKEIYRCPAPGEKRPPSLNSFASHPDDAGEAFDMCLLNSKNELPFDTKDQPYIPIYLGATAGMRILNMTNRTVSHQILEAAKKTLSSSKYKFKKKDARIISGEEEAVGGWTTTNYLMKNLDQPLDKTVGSLDLGGASAEIAFEVPFNSSTTTASEKLFNREYHLYARSYLCYGQTEAHARFLAHLHSNAPSNTTVSNPCMITNASVTYHHSEIYTGCVKHNSNAAMEAFGFGLAPPTSLGTDYSITFNGTWDPAKCQSEISDVFNFSRCWPASNCQSGGNFTAPAVNGYFVGFSAFYYTARYFNLANGSYSNAHSWEPFYTQVKKNCTNSSKSFCLDHLGKPKRGCYQRCFNGMFMPYLLEQGFGFNSNNSWNVTFEDKVQDVSVGWALGYMLSETSSIPQEHFVELRPYTAVDLVVGIIILSILCIVFVIFFFLTFYACRKALRPRNGFQPI